MGFQPPVLVISVDCRRFSGGQVSWLRHHWLLSSDGGHGGSDLACRSCQRRLLNKTLGVHQMIE
jgi:hypothetical protein